MAKTCQTAREEKRAQMRAQQAQKRLDLKKKVSDPNISEEERREAMFRLNGLPKDGSPVRTTRRCQKTGRSRGVYRKFQLSRIAFREMALQGMLPGVTKASW